MRDRILVRLGLAALLPLSLAVLGLTGCAKPATQTQTPPPPANEATGTTTSATTATTPAAPYSRYDLVFAVAGDSRSAQAWMDTTAKKKPDYGKYINKTGLAKLRDNLSAGWGGSPGFLLVHLGDFGIRGGTPIFDEFKTMMSPMRAKGIPVYPVKGNHEVRYYVPDTTKKAETYENALKAQDQYRSAFATWLPAGAVSMDKNYSGLAYRFKSPDGGTAFIVMDAYYVSTQDKKYHKGYYSDPELRWLQDSLITYKQDAKVKQVFVMSHQPAFDAVAADGSLFDDYNSDRSARSDQIMWVLMNNYGATAYFCGHSHFYHRWNVAGSRFGREWSDPDWFDITELGQYRGAWETTIPQVLNGAAGAPLQSLTKKMVKDPSQRIAAAASAEVQNFSIVYVKGDTVTVEVYSYGDRSEPADEPATGTWWEPKLIDKFQGQNHVWKTLELVPEQP
ncbi:MAG: hypothetical protein C0418_03460 [Coriobacteriaceae bacterium]|nr:hypothetical protein [Coriobacteriaceae bacterium]